MMDASDRGMSEVVDARFMSDSQQSLPTLVPLLREGEQPRLVAFPAGESGSVLHCRSLRDQLHPRPSPFIADNYRGGGFVSDDDRINLQAVHFASAMSAGARSQGRLDELAQQTGCSVSALPPCTLRAGPRETIYFEPATTQMAIVTCGELCPGLNDVIRGIVLKALDYGVPEGNILGIRHGLCGFYDKHHKPLVLSRSIVDDIHLEGGTMLGTCKEPADLNEVVKRLDLWKIDMLFVIGGPGSHTGAVAIQEQCSRSNVLTTVIAVPKSIDNDILLVDKTFGFETAVEEAQKALLAAQVEATSGYRGVGLVKLMGKRSGFIAVQASLASGLVDVCLIPEVKFDVDKVTTHLESVLQKRGHAVVCIAEGAGQDYIPSLSAADRRSILERLSRRSLDRPLTDVEAVWDVGSWMKSRIKSALKDVDVKYIDAGYLIRSVPTNSADRVMCRMLAHGAVHAAFAGFTEVTVGLVNTHIALLPIPPVIQATRRVDPKGELWARLRSSIGQPSFDP